MAGGDILKHLLRAYKTSDHSEFRRAALQLAAQESKAGHTKLADEIRKIIGEFPSADVAPAIMDIAKPRGELADLMEGGFCRERLQDIILSDPRKDELERIIRENRQRNSLEQWGVSSRRKLLLIGPPGCGKTLAARVLAGELSVPLLMLYFLDIWVQRLIIFAQSLMRWLGNLAYFCLMSLMLLQAIVVNLQMLAK